MNVYTVRVQGDSVKVSQADFGQRYQREMLKYTDILPKIDLQK